MFGAFNMENILKALTLPGAATEAVSAIMATVAPLLDKTDQATLKEALADVQAGNDEGHARLQAKLAAAAKR